MSKSKHKHLKWQTHLGEVDYDFPNGVAFAPGSASRLVPRIVGTLMVLTAFMVALVLVGNDYDLMSFGPGTLIPLFFALFGATLVTLSFRIKRVVFDFDEQVVRFHSRWLLASWSSLDINLRGAAMAAVQQKLGSKGREWFDIRLKPEGQEEFPITSFSNQQEAEACIAWLKSRLSPGPKKRIKR